MFCFTELHYTLYFLFYCNDTATYTLPSAESHWERLNFQYHLNALLCWKRTFLPTPRNIHHKAYNKQTKRQKKVNLKILPPAKNIFFSLSSPLGKNGGTSKPWRATLVDFHGLSQHPFMRNHKPLQKFNQEPSSIVCKYNGHCDPTAGVQHIEIISAGIRWNIFQHRRS